VSGTMMIALASSSSLSGISQKLRVGLLACLWVLFGVLLPALPVGAQSGAQTGADAAAAAPDGNQEIFVAQTLLTELGLYEGEIDGKINAATREALKLFQEEVGLEVSGELDPDTNQAFVEILEASDELLAEEEPEFVGVECRGYNLTTDAPVIGDCVEGAFEGVDEETGSSIVGKCVPKGDMDGLDMETQQRVFGTCEAGSDRVPEDGEAAEKS